MDYKTLQKDINTILYDQNRFHPLNHIEYTVVYPGKSDPVSKSDYEPTPAQFESVTGNHTNVDLLIRLYGNLSEDTWKRFFLDILKERILEGEYKNLKYFLLEFLIKIHKIGEVFAYWVDFSEVQSFRKLGSLIYFEPECFSLEDLEGIKEKSEKDLSKGYEDPRILEEKKIVDLVMNKRYKSLSEKLIEKVS